jgi:Zn-finger nucleic acid-binding protein
MNSPDFTRCAGCGRALGLEPIAEGSTLSCPRCDAALAGFGAASGRLHDCARCGGQLVEHALLRDLLERTELCGALISRVVPHEQAAVDRVRYLPCPACRGLMNRTNFGTHSGVIVDVCMRHGIWFDAGELPRVLEFVESGGLQRARRRQLEEVANAKRAALSSRVRSEVEAAMAGARSDPEAMPPALDGGGSLSHSSPPAWSTGLWDDAREAASEVLEGLTKLLRRS